MVDTQFGRAVEAERAALKAFAMKYARDADVANDLVQETMLKAIEKQGQFTPGTSLKAWMFTILHNTFVSWCRRGSKVSVPTGQRRVVFNTEFVEQSVAIAGDDQAAAYEAKDALSHLFELPTHHRDALLMCADGNSYEDIARHEGVQVGTIKSRINRGREQLQQRLGHQPSRLLLAYRMPQSR